MGATASVPEVDEAEKVEEVEEKVGEVEEKVGEEEGDGETESKEDKANRVMRELLRKKMARKRGAAGGGAEVVAEEKEEDKEKIVKEFLHAVHVEKDMEKAALLVTEDVKVTMPMRDARRGWYISETVGKEEGMESYKKAQKEVKGFFGYPLQHLDDEIIKVDDDDGGHFVGLVTLKRRNLPTVWCMACCTATPMTFRMKELVTVKGGKVNTLARVYGSGL